MKILAVPATNSLNGINRQLLGHAARLLDGGFVADAEVELVDINDYEMPIYSPAREEQGIPDLAHAFRDKIGAADAVIISFAEHNGSYSAAWKNLYDWVSRIDKSVYQGRTVALFAASPGGRGGAGVLGAATASAPFFGAKLVGSLGLGNFHTNFDVEKGELTNPELRAEFEKVLRTLADDQGD